MTAPFFTTDDSQVTLLEGVYIEETNPPGGVTQVSLNTVGIYGKTLKGPDTPTVINSASRFAQVFGGGYLNNVRINDVWTSLLNKGFSSLVVNRVRAAAAVKASFEVNSAATHGGTNIATIQASSVGTWGNSVKYSVVAASDGNTNHWNLIVIDTVTGITYTYQNLDTSATGNNNTAAIIGTDDGRLIDIVKLADGRPVNNTASTDGADALGFVFLGQTVSGYTSVAGTDGSVADTDYTGVAKPLQVLATYPGVAVVMCAEYTSATIKAATLVCAAASSDRMFLIGANDQTILGPAAESDAATYIDVAGRLIYCYNHPYTIDPITGIEGLVRPESWMACVLANTDIDIHPGEQDTKQYLAGITRLSQPSLARADYIALKTAGIAALEIDLGQAVFVSGEVTCRTPGKTQITRRRMTDFLQLSAAGYLRYSVKKKMTAARQTAIATQLRAWLNGLKTAQRVVNDFTIDPNVLNNATDLGNGIYRVLMRVQLIGHMLFIVLQTEIGTSVVITEQT